MTKFEVQSDVSMPPKNVRAKTGLVDVMRRMKVGDSVAIENPRSVFSSAKAAGIKAATRMMPDGTWRFWRVE